MTYVLPPYTPERIASHCTAEPHNPGDPMPNDVAFANACAVIEACEVAGCLPDEIGLDAIGGLAMYWDESGLNIYAFKGGSIVATRSMLATFALASPAEAAALASRVEAAS